MCGIELCPWVVSFWIMQMRCIIPNYENHMYICICIVMQMSCLILNYANELSILHYANYVSDFELYKWVVSSSILQCAASSWIMQMRCLILHYASHLELCKWGFSSRIRQINFFILNYANNVFHLQLCYYDVYHLQNNTTCIRVSVCLCAFFDIVIESRHISWKV